MFSLILLRFLVFSCAFGAVLLLVSKIFLPIFVERYGDAQTKQAGDAERRLEAMFFWVTKRNLFIMFVVSPVLVGAVTYAVFNNIVFAILGLIVGFILPNLVLTNLEARRKAAFENQMIDSIMILSSSLKSGLSLLQSLEVIAEEMPAPISQEFGLVVRENRMGITLEQSLLDLNKRMKIEELFLMVNSILVARETGGDLTKVLSRLVTTIRDNRKLKDSIKTLTLQGRLQGVIMSVLPFAFVAWVIAFNRHHFDIMFQSNEGRMLLILAVVLQAIGLVLIYMFSRIRI